MEHTEIKRLCAGLDIFTARNRLLSMYPEMNESDIEITYQESEYRRFMVTDCRVMEGGKVMLYAASRNAASYLPSIFQENDFLRRYLMIFQHLHNDISIRIDNINELFRPMHCPSNFLGVLAEWLGINIELLGSEESRRLFLQYAIPLFRMRGTAMALKIYAYILTGIVPQIEEGFVPFSRIDIYKGTDVTGRIFNRSNAASVFTVVFPVERDYFDDNLIKRLSLLLQQEKPVNAECYISFRKKKAKPRKKSVILENSTLGKKITF